MHEDGESLSKFAFPYGRGKEGDGVCVGDAHYVVLTEERGIRQLGMFVCVSLSHPISGGGGGGGGGGGSGGERVDVLLLSDHPVHCVLSQLGDVLVQHAQQHGMEGGGGGMEGGVEGLAGVLEGMLRGMVHGIPLPPAGVSVRVTFPDVGGGRVVTVGRGRLGSGSGRTQGPLERLFRSLCPQDVVHLVVALVAESPVLLVADGEAELAEMAEGIMSLMHPFAWPFVYIPVLPPNLLTFIEAPSQFVVGAPRAELAERLAEGAEDRLELDPSILVVDLGAGRIRAPAYAPGGGGGGPFSMGPLTSPVVRTGMWGPDKYSGLAHDRVLRMVSKLQDLGVPESLEEEDKIRCVFEDEFASLLSGYRAFYLGQEEDEGLGMVGDLFDFSGFVASRPEADQEFALRLTRTECFFQFVLERMRSLDLDRFGQKSSVVNDNDDEDGGGGVEVGVVVEGRVGMRGMEYVQRWVDVLREVCEEGGEGTRGTKEEVAACQVLLQLALVQLELHALDGDVPSLAGQVLTKVEEIFAKTPEVCGDIPFFTQTTVLDPLRALLKEDEGEGGGVSDGNDSSMELLTVDGMGGMGGSSMLSPMMSPNSSGVWGEWGEWGEGEEALVPKWLLNARRPSGLPALETKPTNAVDLSIELVTLLVAMFKGLSRAVDDMFVLDDPTRPALQRESGHYARVLQISGCLAEVDVGSMDEEARVVFFLNVHNALAMHATIELRPPTSFLSRRSWSKASYVIGGHVYSLTDLEHGVLRGSSSKPSVFGVSFLPISKFSRGDPRAGSVLTAPVPYVDFGLASGTRSSAPVSVFTLDSWRRQLVSSFAVVCGSVAPDLPRVLQWYSRDYAGLCSDVFRTAREGGGSVKYAKYDWRFEFKFVSEIFRPRPEMAGVLSQISSPSRVC